MSYRPVMTPVQIEQRMVDLVAANEAGFGELNRLEDEYEMAQARYEIAKARALLATYAWADQKGWTEARRVAYAVDNTQTERLHLAGVTAQVKAARAKMKGIQTEIDLVRSISTSIRNSMGLEGR